MAARLVVAEGVERTRTVAVDQYVGLRQQMLDRRRYEVEPRAPLPERDVGDNAGLVRSGRIDAQHVGAVADQDVLRLARQGPA